MTSPPKLYSVILSTQSSSGYESRYIKRGQRSRPRSGSDNNDMIPMESFHNSVIQVKPYSSGQSSRTFTPAKEDIVIEDLEFCDNYYSSSLTNLSSRRLSAKYAASALRGKKHSGGVTKGIEMLERKNGQNRSSFADSKSLSLTDIYSRSVERSQQESGSPSSKDDNELEIFAKGSVRCWESPISDVPTTTQSATDLSVSGSSVFSHTDLLGDTSFTCSSQSNVTCSSQPTNGGPDQNQTISREKLFLAKQNAKGRSAKSQGE